MTTKECAVCGVVNEEDELKEYKNEPICRYCYCAYESSQRFNLASTATMTNFFNELEKRLIKEIRKGHESATNNN